MRRFIMVGVSALVLAACGTTGTTSGNTQQSIAALGVALTAADNTAINYVTLPLCQPATPSGTLCSQAAVSEQIKSAASAAHAAYKAAEASGAATDYNAAQAALSALLALLPSFVAK